MNKHRRYIFFFFKATLVLGFLGGLTCTVYASDEKQTPQQSKAALERQNAEYDRQKEQIKKQIGDWDVVTELLKMSEDELKTKTYSEDAPKLLAELETTVHQYEQTAARPSATPVASPAKTSSLTEGADAADKDASVTGGTKEAPSAGRMAALHKCAELGLRVMSSFYNFDALSLNWVDQSDYTLEQKRHLQEVLRNAPDVMSKKISYEVTRRGTTREARKIFVNGKSFIDVDAALLDSTVLPDFKKAVGKDEWEELRKQSLSYVTNRSTFVKGKIDSLQNEAQQIETKIQENLERINKLESGQKSVDTALMTYALPALGVLMILLMMAPIMYRDKELLQLIFTSGIILEMFTVFLLVATILILGLSGRLESNALGALLGGIAGYVLGRAVASRRQSNANTDTQT